MQKTDAALPSAPTTPSHTTPSLLQAFTPPVPPLPVDLERTPVGSPIADVFTISQHSSHLTKPLPPILGNPMVQESDDRDDQSLVFVEKIPRTPSPDTIVHSKSTETVNSPNYGKHRSMSVGDVELKKAISGSSSVTPLPRTREIERMEGSPAWGDTTLNGIIRDFKGELSQLDPISSSSLDLRDPSTPSRRAALAQLKTDSLILPPHKTQDENTGIAPSPGIPTAPALTFQLPSEAEELEAKYTQSSPGTSPIVPPRTTSLQTPVRSTSRPSSVSAPRVSASRPGFSPLTIQSGSTYGLPSQSRRDSARLRVQHRSTASSSEPSLIPIGDGARVREHIHSILLIHSPNSISFRYTVSPTLMSSQQDLTVNDLTLTHFPSSNRSTTRGEESTDMDTRGKDLASRCWHEDEEFLAKDKIAEWLGGQCVTLFGHAGIMPLISVQRSYQQGGLTLLCRFLRFFWFEAGPCV